MKTAKLEAEATRLRKKLRRAFTPQLLSLDEERLALILLSGATMDTAGAQKVQA